MKLFCVLFCFALTVLVPEFVSARVQIQIEKAYPESVDGLQQLMQDILTSAQDRDEAVLLPALHRLILPGHAQWFVRVFGRADGQALSQVYDTRLQDFVPRLRRDFERMLADSDGEMEIRAMPANLDPDEGRIVRAIRTLRKEPQAFYYVNWRRPTSVSGWNIGYFVYVEGAFRQIDVGVLSVLSVLRPVPPIGGTGDSPGLQVGSQVQAAKLIRQVQPRYPREARNQRVEGTVRLRATIGIDGKVNNLVVISGHPLLAEGALKAVRKWKYKPTLLNGKAVTVFTTIDVVFKLR